MKRFAIKLVPFLLAGAIINVGVAWGFVLRPHIRHVTRTHTEVYQHFVWDKFTNPFATDVPQCGEMHEIPNGNWNRLRYRTKYPETVDSVGFSNVTSYQFMSGFPAIAIRSKWSVTKEFKDFENRGLWRVMQLLRVPLWPGFAINTIFYAAVLWVLFAAPFKVRRWRRITRGQCASCGYSLRGTPHIEKCPECGATA